MHLTDDQLNEYLDHETAPEGRAHIESHLSVCDECMVRLTALQTLFAEIESLPELELSKPLAVRFGSPSSLLVPQLPRWLTLTATLQGICALIVLGFAAPVISRYLLAFSQSYATPSFKDVWTKLQMDFVLWLQSLQTFQFPSLPTGLFTLPRGLSDSVLAVSVIVMFSAWAFSNWWLLRKRPNSLA